MIHIWCLSTNGHWPINNKSNIHVEDVLCSLFFCFKSWDWFIVSHCCYFLPLFFYNTRQQSLHLYRQRQQQQQLTLSSVVLQMKFLANGIIRMDAQKSAILLLVVVVMKMMIKIAQQRRQHPHIPLHLQLHQLQIMASLHQMIQVTLNFIIVIAIFILTQFICRGYLWCWLCNSTNGSGRCNLDCVGSLLDDLWLPRVPTYFGSIRLSHLW